MIEVTQEEKENRKICVEIESWMQTPVPSKNVIG